MAKRSNRSDWGVLEMAREKPFAAAAVTVGAAATGLFLWSKRAQIGEQLNGLSDQIGEWRAGSGSEQDTSGLPTNVATTRGMSETGGGNTGRRSGGSGTAGAVSGRGRAKSQATT